MKLELCFQSHNIDLTIKEFLNQNQQVIYDLANLILVFSQSIDIVSEGRFDSQRNQSGPSLIKVPKSNQGQTNQTSNRMIMLSNRFRNELRRHWAICSIL